MFFAQIAALSGGCGNVSHPADIRWMVTAAVARAEGGRLRKVSWTDDFVFLTTHKTTSTSLDGAPA